MAVVTYRPDVDGLRAAAVLAVVFYHAGFKSVGGGFTGVDVFFVISGFLITSLLTADLEAGTFSLLTFYDRRIRRIFPAFLLVASATVMLGYFLLMPGEYIALGRSALAAVGFAANFFFSSSTGYFDGPTQDMPLLHVWSLAVEEQFYLLWPLSLWLIWRLPPRQRLTLIAVLAVLSFAVCVHGVLYSPKITFYLLHTRAWELLLGAIAAILIRRGWDPPNRLVREAMAAAGAVCIGVGVFALKVGDPFPGWNALWPCAGTFLLILATPATLVGQVLSTTPAVLIGKISYSLYLWHWPMIVFYRLYVNKPWLSTFEAAGLIVAAIVLAWATWKWVENPPRRSGGWRQSFVSGGLAMAGLATLFVAVVTSGGFPERITREAQRIASTDEMWRWSCPHSKRIDGVANEEFCVIGVPWDDGVVKGIVWGDSHAQHFAPLLDSAARDKKMSLLMLPQSCAPFIDDVTLHMVVNGSVVHICGERYRLAMSLIDKLRDASVTILAARWSIIPPVLLDGQPDGHSKRSGLDLMERGMGRLVETLRQRGHTILLLAEVPPTRRDLRACILRSGLWRQSCDNFLLDAAVVRTTIGSVTTTLHRIEARPGVLMVEPASAMCDEHVCSLFLNGEFLYSDDSHLRRNLLPATVNALTQKLGLGEALNKVMGSFVLTHPR
jgi:peptidoglycan/LPS O-acetylase OafA/YrhL